MSGSIQQALEVVRKAIDYDTSGNYAEAYNAYLAAIKLFQRALLEDASKNPQFQKLITDKVNEYQQRASVIQQYLQTDTAPRAPAAAASPTVAALRSSSFPPSTSSAESPSPPPAYSSAPAPTSFSSPPPAYASTPARPPSSAGHQPLATTSTYAEPSPAAGSPSGYPSPVPKSSPAATPAVQPHLQFNWFYADRSVSAFVRKWQFSWDSHREKFDVLERRNPYLRSCFNMFGSEGPENNTVELKDHKVQRFSESAGQWEAPMSIGTELRVAFTTDKHAQFIACLPEYRNTLGADGVDRQWQAWAQAWLGIDVSREHRLVDEADVETEVEKHMTHWGKQAIKLKKTVPLESSVIVFEAIVEWATLRPHTAAFTVCSLGRDQQATMEKQFFVFEWPDAPSGRTAELTTAVEEWDDEFDKEVRKYMEELRENMGQPNSRPEPRAYFPDSDGGKNVRGNVNAPINDDETDDEDEEDLSARMRALQHGPQQGRKVQPSEAQPPSRPQQGVAATAPAPIQRPPASLPAVAPAASVPSGVYAVSEAPQHHYRQPPPGQDVSNTILLGEISLLRQEMAMLKEVYINEILALKSMVQTLVQAQGASVGSTNPAASVKYPNTQPGGPRI